MAIQSIAKWITLIAINMIISKETVLIDVSVVHKRNAQTEKVSFLESEKGENKSPSCTAAYWWSLVALC